MPSFDFLDFLSHTPLQPGIYQMFDKLDELIYVGKAKNLQARLRSYFYDSNTNAKTRVLVSRINTIKLIVTHTENEALLLEQTLIKAHKPRYNIIFRDDKSYPYLYLSGHKFPNLRFVRGHKRKQGQYFGPYANSIVVRESLELIQKFFKLRSCEDSFFTNRSRPCLQYQIKRCKAPCVNLVSQAEYQQDVEHAALFLKGKNQLIVDKLTVLMQQAAAQFQFEKALECRELISALQVMRQKQYVAGLPGAKDFDVVFIVLEYGVACIQKLMMRDGNLLDNKSFFIDLPVDLELNEVLNAFLAQHYLHNEQLPPVIYINESAEDQTTLAQVLSAKYHQSIKILRPQRGEKLQWLNLAKVNATQTLYQYQSERATYVQRFVALADALKLVKPIKRIECFDISHTQGEATVASCIVFNPQGAEKKAYRRFNINHITPGDDYAAMRQVLTRRYKHTDTVAWALPDILLIDGGKGQLTQAEGVLAELGIGRVMLLGIAKGLGRKPGLETILLSSQGTVLDLQDYPLGFLLLQEIRDEAHRFAITGHRKKRDKQRKTSLLEGIDGVGATRRRNLLNHFGGLQGLQHATVEQIAKVPTISAALAMKIHQAIQ